MNLIMINKMSSNSEAAPSKEESEIPENIKDEIDNLNSEFQENYTVLSRKMRIYIFSLFLILSVVVDLESGIFNSSVDYLQADLNMNNAEYGLFVSISFTGRIIGLVIFMFLLNFKHRKYTLIATIFLHGSSYALYQISSNSYILTFAKMFAAGNKVCASIYRPVWIEQFGLSKYKSVFFSLVQIMSSYGQIIGFSLGSLLFKSNWKMGLLSILGMMYIIAIGFLVVPGKYFFRSYMYYEDKLVDIEDSNEDYATRSSTPSIAGDTESARSSTKGKKRYGSVFVNAKNVEKQKREKSGEKKVKKTLWEKFKNLLSDLFLLVKNKIFLLCMIKRANTTFILQIVHSYLKQYQQHSLEEVNEDLIVLFYSISSLGSTAVGGLLGGIITKKLGGYESKKSTYIVIIPEILTAATISFLAFTKNFYIYNINLILFFCFISIGSPVIQGYLIKTIPKSIKGIGVGLDMIVSTFLGKIPGPVIYGALEDKYLNENRALAWQICMCYFYVGVIIVFILCYFKYKEEAIKDSVEVKIEDNIVNLAAISSGTDANDFFSMKMPVPKRSKSMKYNFRIQSEDKDTEKNSILSSILEGNEKEENDDKDEKTEKTFSIDKAGIKLDDNDNSVV